jgi:hypothetical protein
LAGFIALQWPQEVQIYARELSTEIRPFLRCLLHSILAKTPMPLREHRAHPFIGLHF